MKKLVLSIIIASVLLVSYSGNAYAESDFSSLSSAVDKVVGTPYKWGGTTTEGFDCSGFMQYIFNDMGVKLSRTTKSQAKEGTEVKKKDLRAGDLVFFNTDGKGISHAGIYMGDGLFAHSSENKGVEVSKLSESYYEKRYVTARRILSDEQYSSLAVRP